MEFPWAILFFPFFFYHFLTNFIWKFNLKLFNVQMCKMTKIFVCCWLYLCGIKLLFILLAPNDSMPILPSFHHYYSAPHFNCANKYFLVKVVAARGADRVSILMDNDGIFMASKTCALSVHHFNILLILSCFLSGHTKHFLTITCAMQIFLHFLDFGGLLFLHIYQKFNIYLWTFCNNIILIFMLVVQVYRWFVIVYVVPLL